MKKNIPLFTILLCFLACAWFGLRDVTAQSGTQGQLATDVELKSTGQNGSTINNCTQVTFIFRASYTGNIGGIAFTSTDVPLTIRADAGSVLRAIPYTVTAGTLAIAQVH